MRQFLGLAAAVTTAVVGLPAPAASAAVTTLFVNNADPTRCSDTGSGTLAQPFCTVSAAAKVVEPGQTVRVMPTSGGYFGDVVHITRSGTPEQPITFLGGPITRDAQSMPLLEASSKEAGSTFVVSNAHDVVIKGFRQDRRKNPVVITDSSRITVEQNWFQNSSGTADIRISGNSDHVTVARNLFPDTLGVAVDAGVRSTLITANDFSRTTTSAVTVKDAPQTAVTNNTIAFSCEESVLIDGASPGAVVENNVITADHPDTTKDYPAECDAAHRGEAEISLSVGSVADSKVDFNTVHPWPGASTYRWSGTGYPTPAAFTAATGQAAHDIDLDVAFEEAFPAWPFHPLPDSARAATDSADPAAPGVGTDLYGSKPLDDPRSESTAPNVGGFRDRGAYENVGLQGSLSVIGDSFHSPHGPIPLTVRATASASDGFGGSPISYSFDFGDGSAPVVSTAPEATHTYTVVGSYPVTVTLTTASGARVTPDPTFAKANQPGPLTVDFTTWTDGGGNAIFSPTATSPWDITAGRINFGDGSGDHAWYPSQNPNVRYHAPGTYTVTVAATDATGKEVVTTKQLKVVFDAEHRALLDGEKVQVLARTDGGLVGAVGNFTQGVWGPAAAVPNGGPAAADITSVADSVTSTQYLRAVVLANGRIRYIERNLGGWRFHGVSYIGPGDWSPWTEPTEASGLGPLAGITQIAAASIGEQTHVVALAGGRVYEATLDAGFRWTAWGDVTAAAKLPAGTTQIAAGTTGNALHIAALGADGRIRVADGDYTRGTWSSGDITGAIGSPGTVTQIAGAALGSKFHVLALVGGSVFQASGDYAAGRWSSWANVSAVVGRQGAVTQLSAAGTGNTLRLFGVSGGHVYNANGDYTAGRWSAWGDVTAPGAAGSTAPVTGTSAAGTG
ncbi:PKD domain-containing protein [Kitasatospora sp. NPDC048365]|uniref:PKD domain-containing protein n=1 Tax=Kitasatospora sp. NPDC048365 TaxID=3364050 RepID=UPI003724388B